MGIAHFGIGFAAKPAAEKIPVWVLLIAGELLDILFMIFLGLGIETMGTTEVSFQTGIQYIEVGYAPWSHGLFMSLVWSFLAIGVGFILAKEWRTAWIFGLVVFSHWLLDFLTHGPDLPLFFDVSPGLGLGLWTFQPGLYISAFLEAVLFVGGLAVFLVWKKRKKKS